MNRSRTKPKKKSRSMPEISILVGKCRYCSKDIYSDDSFVSFFSKDHAHYQCMKDDDIKQQQDPRHNQY